MSSEPIILSLGLTRIELIVYLAVIFLLIIVSGFFSKCETIYSTVSQAKLRSDVDLNKKGARKALYLVEEYEKVLAVILFGNNFVNIAISTLAVRVFIGLLASNEPWVDIVSTIVITIIVLIFGEFIPKSVGKRKNETLALKYSGIFYIVFKVLYPISLPFYSLNKLFTKKHPSDNSLTSNDLENILDTMEESGSLEEDEKDMLQNVLDLNETTVKDIMTPRVDVVSLEANTSLEDVKKSFLENQYSRVPVYEGTIDNVIGVLNEKVLFKAINSDQEFDLHNIISKPLFVVSTMKADDLLKALKKANTHMAIVIDEFGGFDGIVTMEDTLEELVGEIFDEHDDVPTMIKEVKDSSYIVDGDFEIDNLIDELDFEEFSEEFESTTISGLLQEKLERVPEVGDEVSIKVLSKVIYDELDAEDGNEYKNLKFKVLSVEHNRVTKVELNIVNE